MWAIFAPCIFLLPPQVYKSQCKDAKGKLCFHPYRRSHFSHGYLEPYSHLVCHLLRCKPMNHLCRWYIARCWFLKSTFQLKSTSLLVKATFFAAKIHRFVGEIPSPVDVPFERLVPRRWDVGNCWEMKPTSWGLFMGLTMVITSKSWDVIPTTWWHLIHSCVELHQHDQAWLISQNEVWTKDFRGFLLGYHWDTIRIIIRIYHSIIKHGTGQIPHLV